MPSSPAIPFVDLKRSFQAWRPDRKPDEAASEAEADEIPVQPRSWTWMALLQNRRVVVLAEPGSGKTREMQEAVARLRQEGKVAYFVRLDRLVSASLPEVLGPQAAKDIEQARRNGREVYYFLDSVDEAKLTRPSDFYAALGKFSAALGSAGRSGAHVFLSSRVSEWRHETDYDEVTTQLCEPLQEQMVASATGGESALAKTERLLMVKMIPLEPEQVKAFAEAIGTREPEQFIEAIDRAFAWEFARRPLDVIDLTKFWNEARRLGTLTELVEAHVRRNLKETPERARATSSPLTEADALNGAMTLAAATIFCKRSAFAILPGVDGLDATECLPAAWSPAQTNALLGRALFDDASFGKRQFHQRHATDFLAAKWIEARMAHGCTIRTLKDMFFEPPTAGLTLRPSLDATAAWLCGINYPWSEDFRSWVLTSRPEIHLSFGDPEALSPAYRRNVLHAIAARYADRQRSWIEADHTTLSRFATPELAADIAQLFLDATTALQLRWHLLHMAAVRKLAGCLDAALILVAIDGVDHQLRTEAVDFLAAVGDANSLRQLASVAGRTVVVNESLGMALIRALYPDIISTVELVDLAARVREDELPIFPTVLAHYFQEHRPPAHPDELLHTFLELMQREPHLPVGRGIPLSQQFARLRLVLLPLATSLLQRASLTADEVDDVVLALLLVGERAHDFEQERINALTKATERHQQVRRAYFVRCIELAVGEDGQEPRHYFSFPLGHDALLHLEARDFGWLVADVALQQNTNRRLTLFRIALHVWLKTGRQRTEKNQLLTAIRDAPAMLEELRKTMADVRRAPFRWWWEAKVRARFGESFWWKDRWRKIRQWIELLRLRLHLNCHLWRLASGNDPGQLCWLARQADEKNHSRWTAGEWTGVSRRYGLLVRWAARTGCKRMWRRHNPGPPSAKLKANRTSAETIAGLNGIQAEWEDRELDFAALPEADARTATFYAVNELNAPAPWLNELALAQPRAVGDALTACIEDEWSMRPDPVRAYGVMAKVLGHADALGDLVQPGILSLIAQGDPTQPQILDFALRLLTSRRANGLAEVVRTRALAAPVGCAPSILWAAAWLRVDAAAAIAWLQTLPVNDAATDQLVVGICSSLHGGDMFRPLRDPNASFWQPRLLVELIRIVYRHVRLAEDQEHHGSYSPNTRDHAQEFRNGLISILAEQSGEQTATYLTTLANDPALLAVRDYILDRSDAAFRARARLPAWRASEIRDFVAADETDPRSDRDLNHITLKRLEDINYAVELSDNSLRGSLRATDNEAALRRFVAAELQRRANGRYQPPQESVIDEERRPDVRVMHPAVVGPISIEIKWAENWTVVQLLDALETQLVGTYLRPHDSHYGIFLVGMIARGGQTHWANPVGGPQITFRQVIAILEERAAQLLAATHGVHGLVVIGIDFRPPSQWEP